MLETAVLAKRVPLARVAGVVAFTLALVWFMGGQRVLGRIDPALVLPLLPAPALLLALSQRGSDRNARWGAIGVALAMLMIAQAVSALILAYRSPWPQLGIVAPGWVAFAIAADFLLQWRRGRAVTTILALLLVGGGFVAGHAALALLYRAAPAAGPSATMLTGLPLRWSGGSDFAAMIAEGANEAPSLLRLEAAGPVRLVDSLVDNPPPPGGALLLAHPRALAPRELVAVDAFVRGGGHAVILADALTAWPTRHPLGDPRNPPITSLLTPLFDHWGVVLGAVPQAGNGAAAADVDGARLQLFSAGAFERLPPTCSVYAARRVAHCPIGRGDIWLVGDADLLFAPLWQPPQQWASHLRRADTMEWLALHLWADAPQAVFEPLWIRTSSE